MVGKCSAGFPSAERAAGSGWGVGGVGSERVLRAWQGRGNHKDRVVTPGKDRARAGQRQRVEYGR